MTMRILFVSPYIPSPIRVRPYQWIRSLSRLGHEVHLVALHPPEDRWIEDVPVRDCCASVAVYELSRGNTLRNAAAAVPKGVPLQAAYSHHPEAERAIARAAEDCDVVHVEHLRGAVLAQGVNGTPRVLDAVDSITTLFEQAGTSASSWKHRLMARVDVSRTRRFEARLADRFDRIVVSSTGDADAFRRVSASSAKSRIVAVPNGVDTEYFRPGTAPPLGPSTILFTGKMSYHANDAAALRLVRGIMPIVWRGEPQARVVIAGKNPSHAVEALASDSRVTVTGYVRDLRSHFHAATMVLAPLVYAVGIQNKVLEAMACGVPVVASAEGCRGLEVSDGAELLVGRTDDQLAASTLSLLGDSAGRRALADRARRFVVTRHNWSNLTRQLVSAYEQACGASPSVIAAPGGAR
jgi:polysaccharide biosynthesis protein PslH